MSRQAEKYGKQSSFADRLRISIAMAGMQKADLAKAIEVHPVSISRWLKEREPDLTTAKKLADTLNVRYAWLATGEGEPTPFLNHLAKSKEQAERIADTPEDQQAAFENDLNGRLASPAKDVERPAGARDVCWIPVVSWEQAGKAASYDEIPRDGRAPIPTLCDAKDAFAVEIEGDGMEPRVVHGDCVALMPREEPRDGCLVVAKLKSNGVMIRRYTRQRGGTLLLTAYNPTYPSRDYDSADFHWIFPVHSVIRREW